MTSAPPVLARLAVPLALAALWWERTAAVWAPPALAVVGVLAAAALGLLQPLPIPLHAAVVGAALAAGALVAVLAARRVRPPTLSEARRRVEAESDLRHAPLSALQDEAAEGDPALWALHRSRAEREAARARPRRPRAGLAAADPLALRYALPVAALLGLALAGTAAPRRLETAFRPDLQADAAPLVVEAWAAPPPYTGRPPQPLSPDRPTALPAGSEIRVSVRGAAGAPVLRGIARGELARREDRRHERTIRLTRSGVLAVRRGGRLASWRLVALPDRPPTIAFAAEPRTGKNDALLVVYRARDDYGVVAVRLRLRDGLRSAEFPLDAPAVNGQPQPSLVDLTRTPFAGRRVSAQLIAVDAAGQSARSPARRVRVPERVYTDPAAVRVVAAAQAITRTGRFYRLIRRPPPGRASTQAQAQLMETLGPYYALHDAPRGVRQGAAGLMALTGPNRPPMRDPVAAAGLVWSLRKLAGAQSLAEAKAVAPELYAIADRIETGPAGSAEEALRQAQRRLREAVARRAPPEEIAERLAEVRQAMAAYLAALAESAPPADAQAGGASVSMADLDALWRAVEEAVARGEIERAMALMDAIAQLMAALQPGGQGEGQGGQGGPGALGDLQQNQRKLGDETFGASQGALTRDPGEIAREQDALARRAADAARRGGEAGRRLSEAAEAMAEAAQALSDFDLENAVRAQRRAQNALAEGARANEQGRSARGLTDAALGEADPLGRREGGGGSAGQNGRAAPDDPSLAAREALEAIRARAADRGRPESELQYLDRLLERF